ncbi:DNA cytosine methyltransferase [Sphaerospermopsis kisseleviana CS-549]|uniref:Cytosine-specific methyltransferase n=1 Tax=Sphaerospermopsis kisseleviana CS-549 TaxID=3021783 RepID=A0ABT4ZKF8_9CYAN|nr:DNA cytosine methyltransferase [Sphaerospermopsis kisseleviana]MDB9439876.1 DNA cytosine methyltransferase [Sphaerospermopsis kisseleviana CS-549]BAZ79884.1 cytosine specific DNA methyltransferase [Sphaerospermopsis kisseleviana NIES-73]
MNNNIIDLFAGAGGLSTGFQLAGFEALCAIDTNKKALATYQHNFPNTKVIHQDIREVNPLELREYLGLRKEELNAIIGGPPCQGFSRNIPAEYRYMDDPRNQLYKTFLAFVQEFRPLYVIMENVPEILTAYKGLFKYQITNQLELLGYKVISSSLNAANYGVPQTRARAFFIASLDRSIIMPHPTHNDIQSQHKNEKYPYQTNLLKSNSSLVTVKDAIGDLPELNAGEKYAEEKYPSEPQTTYQSLIRHNSTKITNHIARALSPIQMSRVKLLKEGQDARNLPPELAPKKHYSGAYGRLYWDQPAKTITRWVFHPGSGRFFHPTQNRTITIREAARLHSYPDTFHFLGTYTEMASQIGESVPPLLAKTIAECII